MCRYYPGIAIHFFRQRINIAMLTVITEDVWATTVRDVSTGAEGITEDIPIPRRAAVDDGGPADILRADIDARGGAAREGDLYPHRLPWTGHPSHRRKKT